MRKPNYKVQALAGPAYNKNSSPRSRDAVVIIAGGPSLTREDVAKVEKAEVDIIGINNAYLLTDQLDIHYACDTKWWLWAYSKGNGAPPYPPQEHTLKFSLDDSKRPKKRGPDPGYPGVTQLKMGKRKGISHEWPVVCWGGNGGYQAINLAYLLGYKKIILLGYDMQETGKQAHWHKDHSFQGSTNPSSNTFRHWMKDFRELAEAIKNETDIEVINATRKTALTYFKRVNLEEALWS